ncbi:MAG TPA: BON domain-containing protein [Anaerolineales bacterium]|nr:BON domain-containing protein [Anaerolineales bacterium]
MSLTELPIIHTDEFSRCEEKGQITGLGKTQQNDAVIKEAVYQALWKDNVLRAIEYQEIDVHVRDEIVYLYGHIVGTGSQHRILNAIGKIPGILGIKNHLVLDDKLILDVASLLGELEHTYDCKFFTGASHGVISLSGNVQDENVKLLAEKCAVSNPNVRGVINNVRVSGTEPEAQDQQRFLQPAIRESIYFSDGPSGVVKQVVMNPNNRCVIAMVMQGNFNESRNALYPLANGKVKPLEQLIVVPMKVVRYLTKDSGFLHIKSDERNQYQDFDSASFYTPNRNWTPPYPYCPDDVLFPVEYRTTDIETTYGPLQVSHEDALSDSSFKEELLANDSLGG